MKRQIKLSDKTEERATLLAVFDGHGQDGHKVSKFLVENLEGKFLLEKSNLKDCLVQSFLA